MDLPGRFNNVIKTANLFSEKDWLLLAVSGGVDSIVLCELCKQAGYDFTIAHCNFQLRGEDSNRDEAFVRKLGSRYGVRVLVKQFDTMTYATSNKLSIQEAARELRYNWFKELVATSEPGGSNISKCERLLLTAHHADDTVETLLMNFFRGTGLHGLTGIPVINDYIRRPLLGFYKEELVSFAKANQLEWVEDISNESSKYTRNLFRNEVIPVISSAFPQVKENLLDNIGRFSEIDKLYRHLVDGLVSKLCKYRGNEVHIPVKQLIGFNNRAIIYEIINRFGFSEKQVEEVIKLANSDSGKYITGHNQSYRIIRHRHWFIISPVSSGASGNIVIEKDDKKIEFEQGHILLEYVNAARVSIPPANTTALLDVKMIVYPLLLRKWKTGDYFYPLGMKKKKKLSRFFIDQKLSKTQKENAWVVESGKKIIWVVGYRIDERFKITSDTKEVARITFNNHHQIG